MNESLHEEVLNELVSCYGEGESTDWPYLTDLASLIVSIVEREAAKNADQWERITAVVRATLPGTDADVWDDRILKARDALTPEDIEAVQDIRWSHDQDCTSDDLIPDDVEAVQP